MIDGRVMPHEVPEEMVEAALEAYRNGQTQYTVIHGPRESNLKWVEELRIRDALAAALNTGAMPEGLTDWG